MNIRFPGRAALLAAVCLGFAGCSEVTLVDRDTPYKNIDVNQPDFIVVTPVAVTPEQADMVRAPSMPTSKHVPTSDELRIGNAFASALKTELASAMTTAGIRGYAEGSAPQGSYKTGIILGYCFDGTAGSPGASVGFQIKDEHFRVRLVFNIKEVPVAGVTLDVKTRMHTDSTDVEVNAIADKEAKMAADKIVKELLVPTYKQRGWFVH